MSSDGSLILEYQIAVWEEVRWMFDVQISNINHQNKYPSNFNYVVN